MNKFEGAAVQRLERMYSSQTIVEQRQRTRTALRIRPGERGLDIGCGPGFLLCEMAEEAGAEGRLVGLDASSDMVKAARRRAEEKNLSGRIDARVGEATRLELPASSFDFAAAVQVYLYVKEIERALAEAARVLKPGGRLVVVDTDWDSCVWLTSDAERHRRMIDGWASQFAQPHLPPTLPRLLSGAGLQVESVESFPLLNLRYDADSFSAGVIEMLPRIVAPLGIDPTEAQAWAADLRGRTGEGDYFFSVNRYLFRARRPA
jgi:arsenite methyltransferase